MAHTTNRALTCCAKPGVYTARRNERRPPWARLKHVRRRCPGPRIAAWAGFFTFMTFSCFPVLFHGQLAFLFGSVEGFALKVQGDFLQKGGLCRHPPVSHHPPGRNNSFPASSVFFPRRLQIAISVFIFKMSFWVSPTSEN